MIKFKIIFKWILFGFLLLGLTKIGLAQNRVGQTISDALALGSGASVPLPQGKWLVKANKDLPGNKSYFNCFYLENLDKDSAIPYIFIQEGRLSGASYWNFGSGSVYDMGPNALLKEMYGTSESSINTQISTFYPLSEKTKDLVSSSKLYQRMQELGLDITKLNGVTEEKFLLSDIKVIQPKNLIRVSTFIRLPSNYRSLQFKGDLVNEVENSSIKYLKNWNLKATPAIYHAYFEKKPQEPLVFAYSDDGHLNTIQVASNDPEKITNDPIHLLKEKERLLAEAKAQAEQLLKEKEKLEEVKKLEAIAKAKEDERIALENKAKEEKIAQARLEEQKKLDAIAKVKEEERIALAKQEEQKRLDDIAKAKEEERIAQEARARENERLAAEAKRKEQLLAEAKARDDQAAAEKIKEQQRIAQEAKIREEERIARETKAKEMERLAAEAKERELKASLAKTEAERLAQEKIKEQQRLEAEAKSKEAERIKAEALAKEKEREKQSSQVAQISKEEQLEQLTAQLEKLKLEIASAQAKKNKPISVGRKALVIGNDKYKNVTKLVNADADASLMAENLKLVGYDVTLKLDLTQKELLSALRTFKGQVGPGDEVTFFYAGHGVQLGQSNFILPVDIDGESEDQIKDDAVPLERVLEDMAEKKAKFTLAIVDACRDNPFKTAKRSIGGTRGLAPTSTANGQMIVFSAGAGQQALDNLGPNDKNKNSVFTRVFVKEMQKPGQSIDKVVRNVRNEVVEMAKSVNHEQVPAIYDQVIGEFYFKK
jgi:Caspase domain